MRGRGGSTMNAARQRLDSVGLWVLVVSALTRVDIPITNAGALARFSLGGYRNHAMRSETIMPNRIHPLILLAGIVVVVAGLKSAGPLIQPLLISLFIAALSLPLLNWLHRFRWCPRPLSVAMTVVAVLAVAIGIFSLVGGSINAFTQTAPRYSARLQEMMVSLIAWLGAHRIDIPQETATKLLDPGIVLNMVGDLLKVLATLFQRTLVILLTSIFILVEAAVFPAKLDAAFQRSPGGQSRVAKIRTEIQRYLAIKTAISAATGILIGLALWILGIDFPLMWGLVAFALNFIPSLGSIFAALPTILLAIVQFGLGRAFAVAAVYLIVNLALGNLLEPMLMGRRLGLSPLVVFISMVFWGWVWGPLGMLLSVPLTMIIKIMLEYTDEFRWIAILLDARAPDSSNT